MNQISLFDDLTRPSKSDDIAQVKKSKDKKSGKKTPTQKGGSLSSKIKFIRDFVEQYLGKYREKYLCIRDIETLHNYVDTCLKDGRISLDTETMGLNVFKDKIVGISLFSKSNKPAYIPINHVIYNVADNTTTLAENQLTIEQIRPELSRLIDISEVDMFNAVFDRRVI